MPDLLTHVLVGFVIGTVLSVRYESLGPEHVTLAMIGALSPDFVKIYLAVPDYLVAASLGIPFSWSPLHTLGGSAIVVCLGALLVTPDQRKRAIALFAIGAASHHALDLLLLTATGYSYPAFWPASDYRLPSADLYLSSDRWPAAVAGIGAALAWLGRRYRESLPEAIGRR